MPYAELELILRRWSGDDYTAELRFRRPADGADVYLISGEPPRVRFYHEALQGLQLDPANYGAQLKEMLFADARLGDAFLRARAEAAGAGAQLRLTLRLDAGDEEIHGLRWETIHDPDREGFLATSEQLILSRYLDSADLTPIVRRLPGALTALVAVASPSDLSRYKLAPVDVAGELGRATAALDGLATTVLARERNGQAASLSNLAAALRDGPDILYLVAHGTLRQGRPYLWLEQNDGGIDRIDGAALIKQIADLPRRPALIVLASCESAGAGQSEGALAALGPQLAAAGVAAVLAMQGTVLMETVERFMPVFFAELRRDGQIDRALAAARAAILGQPDWWMPALFLRVRDGMLWRAAGAAGEGTARALAEEQAYNVAGLRNPYVGLRSYTYADRARYAGRARTIAATLELLTAPGNARSLLFVTGASGSGKSSFAQAGLLPALEDYYRARNLEVRRAVFRPSRRPLASFKDALLQLDPRARDFDLAAETATPGAVAQCLRQITSHSQVNLVVIDQFEELFTQSDPPERDALFAALEGLPAFEAIWTHVIATVRADYLPELFDRPILYDIARQGVALRAMRPDELCEAILCPLQPSFPGGEKRFEAALLERLASDAAEDASYLPLLQVTLEDIWSRGSLRLSAYNGLADAISRRAEAVYHYIDYDGDQQRPRPAADQALILDIMLGLVSVSLDDMSRRDVRRRRTLAALRQGSPDRERLIEDLVDARLLIKTSEPREDGGAGEDMVDIVHEALIRNWAALSQAIHDRREQLQQETRFEQAVRDWKNRDTSKPEEDYLLSGVHLAAARELADRGYVAQDAAAAQDLLRLSIAREEAAQQRELARARELAEAQRQRAEAQERARAEAEHMRMVAVTQVLTVQAERFGEQAERRTLAALLARQAYLFNQRIEGPLLGRIDGALRAALDGWPGARVLLSGIRRLAASLDGQQIAIVGEKGWPYLVAPDNSLTKLSERYGCKALAYSPDGQCLAAGWNGAIYVWRTDMPGAEPRLFQASNFRIRKLAFASDNRTLAALGRDGSIQLWDIAAPGGAPRDLGGSHGPFRTMAINPAKPVLVTAGDGGLWLWDTSAPDQAPRAIRNNARDITALAYSPDGQTLAVGGGGVRLLPMAPGSRKPRVLDRGLDDIVALAFDLAGEQLACAGQTAIHLWDLSGPDESTHISMPLEQDAESGPPSLTMLAFRDRENLVSIDTGGHLRRWALHGFDAAILEHPEHYTSAVAFSPDGGTLAVGTQQGAIMLWDMRQPGVPKHALPIRHTQVVYALAFSPDGRTLASASWDRTVRLWDLAQLGAEPAVLPPHGGAVSSVAFTPDGATLITGSVDATVRVWDVGALAAPRAVLRGAKNQVLSVAISSDGRTLAAAYADSTIRLWEMGNLDSPPRALTGHELQVNGVVFTPDGQTLASVSMDRTVRVWRPAQSGIDPIVLRGHGGVPYAIHISRDGRTLATGDYSEIRLWDLAHLDVPPRIFRMPSEGTTSIALSPDGKWLAANTSDSRVLLRPIDIAELAGTVCARANRNLAMSEWREHVGDLAYERTCPDLPVHPTVIAAGRDLARAGDLDGALALLRYVRELDPSLDLDPEQEARTIAAQHALRVGRGLARALDLEQAVGSFRRALELDPSLDLDPEQEARQLVARVMVTPLQQGVGGADVCSLLELGSIADAIAQLRRACEIYPMVDLEPVVRAVCTLLDSDTSDHPIAVLMAIPESARTALNFTPVARTIQTLLKSGASDRALAALADLQQSPAQLFSADSLAQLCLYASLYGHAAEALALGDQAVALARDNPYPHEPRGMARALAGDIAGATEDFGIVVVEMSRYGATAEMVAMRETWLAALRAGRNPFDEALLEQLRGQ